jgi:predicted nuclease with TOPRIM domain
MSVFLTIAGSLLAKSWSGLLSVFTYIWERPVLRNTVLIALALAAAYIYGNQHAKHVRALADQKAAYEMKIKKLEAQKQQADELTQAKADQDAQTAARLQNQDESLRAYEAYLDELSKKPPEVVTVKEKVNGKVVYVKSPCAVDQRMLDALGVRQSGKN